MSLRYLRVGILLLLLLQGFCDTAALFLPSCHYPTKAASVTDAHKAVCHCHNCMTGKRCCCLKARTTAEGIQLRAVCDQPDAVQIAVAPSPRLAPPFHPITPQHLTRPLTQIGLSALYSSLIGRTPEPAIQPPCFLS